MASQSRSKSQRRASGAARTRGPRWLGRVFWLGVVALCVYFAGREVTVSVMSEAGYRRVERHALLLREVGREFEVDPNLLAGVALAESSGRIDAVSSADALGMFQLMLPTARERATLLGLDEPSRGDLLGDAALNARLAASYLRWLAGRYAGVVEPMLVAYNAGPGRLDGWIKASGGYAQWRAARDEPGESAVLDYARKVQRYRERFAERGVIEPRLAAPPAVLSSPPPARSAPDAPAPPSAAAQAAPGAKPAPAPRPPRDP